MALEDFEKSLAEEKAKEQEKDSERHGREARRHYHHRHRHGDHDGHHHRRKRTERSADSRERDNEGRKHHRHENRRDDKEELAGQGMMNEDTAISGVASSENLQRDFWMEGPSKLEVEYNPKGHPRPSEPISQTSKRKDFQLRIHDNELNKHHLQQLADGEVNPADNGVAPVACEVNYTFGDAGSQWRMKKLKRVYERAEEEHKAVDEVAMQQFGDLESFDEAREEQTELDRRATYGAGYIGKEKPSGEYLEERKNQTRTSRSPKRPEVDENAQDELDKVLESVPGPKTMPSLDSTALNRLKAQMMKAKLRGGPQAAALEAEYNTALATSTNPAQPDVVVLDPMESRMLASGRSGEVKTIDNKRGRERGLVEANEDMSISDMVREERRTRTQQGGDGARFAERIAKDAKFSSDLDYMDENAAKLAKRVQRSEVNLKTTAVSDFHNLNRILDTCPLCHHEDTNQPPVAPVVSLGTRVYLTLPTQPELSDGSAAIIPIQHRGNLLECDDDEWEEIRNFMKSLTRMYHDQGRSVLFYENAASGQQRKRHASMEVVPLPYSLGGLAPQFFKEAILTADEEWTQHKKLIDTLAKSRDGSLGKHAFRRTLVKEMPYFHVWFEIDGGLGHVVEDTERWPRGDLFPREIIGGMLDLGPEVVRRQGRWKKGVDERVEPFRKRWKKFDWTRVLMDG